MHWTEVNLQPSPRQLRQFAVACWLVCGGWAGWQIVVRGPGWLNVSFAVLATLIGIAGLTAPGTLRPLYVAATVATFPIGWAVSNLILLALFYLLFTPLAIWFRLTGRDVLRRRKLVTDSYWMTRPPAPAPRRYLRQY